MPTATSNYCRQHSVTHESIIMQDSILLVPRYIQAATVRTKSGDLLRLRTHAALLAGVRN
jgi:hypothetical protein